jgi:hypothetical protein
MVGIAAAIAARFPDAVPLVDWGVASDGTSESIFLWRADLLGAQPTDSQLAEWALLVVPPPPPPDWPGFLAALLQSATFGAAQIGAQQILHDELPTAEGIRQERLLRASTALASLPAVLLAAAQSGDPGLFIGAWLSLRQAALVAPDVAAAMAQLATAYNLPADLIRSLGATPQPP